MPPRNVVPKPVQKPHPPLWVACSRRDTILLAAEKGIGALTFAFIDPEEADHWVTDYERTLAEKCVPVGRAVNPNVACVTPMMMPPRRGRGHRAAASRARNFFGYSLGHYYVFGEHAPGAHQRVGGVHRAARRGGLRPRGRGAGAREERLGRQGRPPATAPGLRGAIGTPDQVREYLRRYEEAGVDQVIFVMQAGRNRHEDIMESLELFGREVLPEFIERDELASKKKAAHWAPICEQVLTRKQVVERDLDGYSFPALPRQWAAATGSPELQEWLERFRDDRAAGRSDTDIDTLGDLLSG